MKVQIIEGSGNFASYRKLTNIGHKTQRAVRKGMFLWGRDLKSTADRRIKAKDKTGRVYIRHFASGARQRHRASAPGEYHANMTGALRRSIGFNVIAADRMEFGYGVDGKDVPVYAAAIEFGHQFKTFKLKARPSIQNAIRDTIGNAETYFAEEIKKEYD